MFTGIIESLGQVVSVEKKGDNIDISVKCSFTDELKIDQSLAHNGVCLTVIDIKDDIYTVTAIDETLQKTNIGKLEVNDWVNLERCLPVGGRLDGHIVQGHVDKTGTVKSIDKKDGSYIFTIQYDNSKDEHFTVEKGSICMNGISLTVLNSKDDKFSVAIIPYTYEHTNIHALKEGSTINLEFDILGKYIQKLHSK